MVPNIQKNTMIQGESTTISSAIGVKKDCCFDSTVNTITNTPADGKPNYKNLFRIPSWRQPSRLEPHFNIGLILDSTNTKDPHVSAINKPASLCQLTSVVVLQPNTHEMTPQSVRDSVGTWLNSNKVAEGVEHLDFIGTGQDGCNQMLASESIHAVYIIALK